MWPNVAARRPVKMEKRGRNDHYWGFKFGQAVLFVVGSGSK
jgi:hypothetical protein